MASRKGKKVREREKDENIVCHLSWQKEVASTTIVPISLLKLKSGKYNIDCCSLSNQRILESFKIHVTYSSVP